MDWARWSRGAGGGRWASGCGGGISSPMLREEGARREELAGLWRLAPDQSARWVAARWGGGGGGLGGVEETRCGGVMSDARGTEGGLEER